MTPAADHDLLQAYLDGTLPDADLRAHWKTGFGSSPSWPRHW